MNKELFEIREVSQEVIDKARYIVDKAEKEATEWITALNVNLNNKTHEENKRAK